MSHTETIEHNGYKIVLGYDEPFENPNEWGDEECFVVGFHRDFEVHRKNPEIKNRRDLIWYQPKEEIIRFLMEEEGRAEDLAREDADHFRKDEWELFPLHAYIHSGVALSLGTSYPFDCRWDACQVGFVFVKKENGWETNEDGSAITLQQIAEWRVETWNQYLSGDIWYVSIQDSDGETIESFGGVYGFDEAVSQGKAECPTPEKTRKVDVIVLQIEPIQHTDGRQKVWDTQTIEVPLSLGNLKVPEYVKEKLTTDADHSVVIERVFVA
jgi:hypothetical protein